MKNLLNWFRGKSKKSTSENVGKKHFKVRVRLYDNSSYTIEYSYSNHAEPINWKSVRVFCNAVEASKLPSPMLFKAGWYKIQFEDYKKAEELARTFKSFNHIHEYMKSFKEKEVEHQVQYKKDEKKWQKSHPYTIKEIINKDLTERNNSLM